MASESHFQDFRPPGPGVPSSPPSPHIVSQHTCRRISNQKCGFRSLFQWEPRNLQQSPQLKPRMILDGSDVFKIRFVRRSEGREEKSGTRAATAMSHRVSTLSQPAFLDAPPWHASTASAAMLHFHFQRCQPPGQRFCSVRIFACYLPVSVTPRFSLRRGYRGRQAALHHLFVLMWPARKTES